MSHPGPGAGGNGAPSHHPSTSGYSSAPPPIHMIPMQRMQGIPHFGSPHFGNPQPNIIHVIPGGAPPPHLLRPFHPQPGMGMPQISRPPIFLNPPSSSSSSSNPYRPVMHLRPSLGPPHPSMQPPGGGGGVVPPVYGGKDAGKPQTMLYVGKIASTVDDKFLRQLLQLCGPIKSWKRAEDPTNGTPRGFGFCEFESADGVLRALRILNGCVVDGQALLLKVNQATQEYLDRVVAAKKSSFKVLEEVFKKRDKANAVEGESAAKKTGEKQEAGGTDEDTKDDVAKAGEESVGKDKDGVEGSELGAAKDEKEGAAGEGEGPDGTGVDVEGKDKDVKKEDGKEGDGKDEGEGKEGGEDAGETFGLITPDDKARDAAAVEKLQEILAERNKDLPPPPPPPPLKCKEDSEEKKREREDEEDERDEEKDFDRESKKHRRESSEGMGSDGEGKGMEKDERKEDGVEGSKEKERGRKRGHGDEERDGESGRDREGEKEHADEVDGEKDRGRDTGRERDRERDRGSERGRDRDRDRDRDRERDDHRERGRGREDRRDDRRDEREYKRVEKDRERDRVRREQDRAVSARDLDRAFGDRERNWEVREKERERLRVRDKEREREKAKERRALIVEQEEEESDYEEGLYGSRYEAYVEEKRRRVAKEVMEDELDREKEVEEKERKKREALEAEKFVADIVGTVSAAKSVETQEGDEVERGCSVRGASGGEEEEEEEEEGEGKKEQLPKKHLLPSLPDMKISLPSLSDLVPSLAKPVLSHAAASIPDKPVQPPTVTAAAAAAAASVPSWRHTPEPDEKVAALVRATQRSTKGEGAVYASSSRQAADGKGKEMKEDGEGAEQGNGFVPVASQKPSVPAVSSGDKVSKHKKMDVAKLFGNEEDEEEREKKRGPLVPLVYDDEGDRRAREQADDEEDAKEASGAGSEVAAKIAAASQFAERLSQMHGKKVEGEGDAAQNGDAPGAPDAAKRTRKKPITDAKSLIDSIPKTKAELFGFPLNWTTFEENNLHERMRPWISKKIAEFLGEEETSLVTFILNHMRKRVTGPDMLKLLEPILDEEAEMFVLKMWRMLIFEIRRVELGLTGRVK